MACSGLVVDESSCQGLESGASWHTPPERARPRAQQRAHCWWAGKNLGAAQHSSIAALEDGRAPQNSRTTGSVKMLYLGRFPIITSSPVLPSGRLYHFCSIGVRNAARIFTPTMTDMLQLHSQFWSKIARKYDPVVDSQIGTNTRAMVRERLTREQNLGSVVEFGCGTGFYTDVLAARSDHLVATDLAPGMLEVAKQNTNAANVTFQPEDCQQPSFNDSTFDTIFMSLVLHFTDPPKALAEMRRILKPGGTLIISNPDPHPLSGFNRFRWIVRGYFYGITRYRTKPPKGLLKNVLAEKQLCDLLANTGFRILSTEVIRDTSRSYNIPVEYIKGVRI